MLTLPALGMIWPMFELPALCEANVKDICGGVDHFKGKLNSPPSMFLNLYTTPRLSGHISIFSLVSLCSSLFWGLRDNGVVNNLQLSLMKPRSHARILVYRKWAIVRASCLRYQPPLKLPFFDI